jgi:hypothetical protein
MNRTRQSIARHVPRENRGDSMNVTALALLGVNYALVISLPFAFFERRDRRRARAACGPSSWRG